MKELAIYFTHIEALLDTEEALRMVDVSEMSTAIRELVFFSDVSDLEYLEHLAALGKMHQLFLQERQFTRLYFGQEFCQHLIPKPEEVLQAYYFSKQLAWDFTYVTGYVTDAGLALIRANLEALAKEGAEVEVVFNDWGVLDLVSSEFSAFKPVLGRLLIKQQRLIRHGLDAPVNMDNMSSPEEQIRGNQAQSLRRLSLSIYAYRKHLKELGVDRVDIDMVPQGVELPPDTWGFGVGVYFPWTYATGARNCLTASAAQPEREFVVVDGPCSRLCRKINTAATAKEFPLSTIQRGNTLFVAGLQYAKPYMEDDIPVHRIIYEPYIPL